jgi:hypothetical protein
MGFLLVFLLLVPAFSVIGVLYLWSLRLQDQVTASNAARRELETQLRDEQRMRDDLVRWIEIECYQSKRIEKALKQRLNERLAVLQQLQAARQQPRQRYRRKP